MIGEAFSISCWTIPIFSHSGPLQAINV